MLLGELIAGVPVKEVVNYDENVEVSHLTLSSSNCEKQATLLTIVGG